METKILMVCLGNICRSPLAEGILASKLNRKLFFVDSAGTSGFHQGELPDSRSILVAKKYGIDLTNQRSRKFIAQDFENFDYIYVMDQSNYKNTTSLARTEAEKQKVRLILEVLDDGLIPEVPDPYYGGDHGFENVYQMLDEACSIIANKLNS